MPIAGREGTSGRRPPWESRVKSARRLDRLEKAERQRSVAKSEPAPAPLWRDILRHFLPMVRHAAETDTDQERREFWTRKVIEMTEAIDILDAYLAAGQVGAHVEYHCRQCVHLTALKPQLICGVLHDECLPFLDNDEAAALRQCLQIDFRRSA
jgi:hypothetical protein